jgi:hypothetical protein
MRPEQEKRNPEHGFFWVVAGCWLLVAGGGGRITEKREGDFGIERIERK